MIDIQPGVYRHYKGGLYTVLFTATTADDHEAPLVIYVSHTNGMRWARPLSEFTGTVSGQARFVRLDPQPVSEKRK